MIDISQPKPEADILFKGFPRYARVKDGIVDLTDGTFIIRFPAEKVFGPDIIEPSDEFYVNRDSWAKGKFHKASIIVRDGLTFRSRVKDGDPWSELTAISRDELERTVKYGFPDVESAIPKSTNEYLGICFDVDILASIRKVVNAEHGRLKLRTLVEGSPLLKVESFGEKAVGEAYIMGVLSRDDKGAVIDTRRKESSGEMKAAQDFSNELSDALAKRDAEIESLNRLVESKTQELRELRTQLVEEVRKSDTFLRDIKGLEASLKYSPSYDGLDNESCELVGRVISFIQENGVPADFREYVEVML